MPRPQGRFFAGLLVCPPLFTAMASVLILATFQDMLSEAGEAGWVLVATLLAGILLVSSVFVFLFIAPYLTWLSRRNIATLPRLVVGAFLAAAMGGVFVTSYLGYGIGIVMAIEAGIYGVCGMLMALMVWGIGQRKGLTKPDNAPPKE